MLVVKKIDEYIDHPSGLWVPKQRRPTGIDLFCGAGGFSLGYIQAGWEVLAGLDNDPACAITYTYNLGSYPVQFHYAEPEDKERLNSYLEQLLKDKINKGDVAVFDLVSGGGWIRHHPEFPPVRHFFFGDARKFTGKQILEVLGLEPGEVDCVFGGPPCQGFSTLGKRDVMDPRNSLVFEFCRLALEIRPEAIIFENVPGILDMVTPEGLPVVDAICRVLEDGNFGTFNALKRSLLATSGAGAVIRGKPAKDIRSEQNDKGQDQQPSLF